MQQKIGSSGLVSIDASYFFLPVVLDGFALPCFRPLTSVAMFFACSEK